MEHECTRICTVRPIAASHSPLNVKCSLRLQILNIHSGVDVDVYEILFLLEK